MSPRKTWLDSRVDVVLAELDLYGLTLPRDHVAQDIRHRLTTVATQMGVTEKTARTYISEDLVRGVARDMAVSVAHEAPGGEPLDLPATHSIPSHLVGRTIAALVVITQLIDPTPPADASAAAAVDALPPSLIFAWAICIARADEPATIRVHPSLIHRTTRALTRGIDRLQDGACPADGGYPADLAGEFEHNIAALEAAL